MTEYLDEIQRRADAAHPEPWVAQHGVTHDWNEARWVEDAEGQVLATLPPVSHLDADFIAHARTDVPRLVAEQRDLIRLLDAAREDKTKARRQRSEYRLRAMRAEAALRAVEALHQPIEYVDGTGCAVCGYPFRIHDGTIAGTLYPCPTVTAIRDALEAR